MKNYTKSSFLTVVLVAAFAILAAGSGSSSGTSPTPAASGSDVAAELAAKGSAATVRDHLLADACSGGYLKTPYIDLKDEVTPYAADHVLFGQWIDPGVEGLDSSKNGQVQSVTVNDLGWYNALDALCNPTTTCQGDVCELTDPNIYLKTRIEMRVINGQPRISAVFKGVSMGGANTPLLETAYAAFVTAATAQLPAAAAAPAAVVPAAPAPAAPAAH